MVTKLKNTTTLSNSEGNAPPDEKIILQQAEQAFTDNAESMSLAGSATQRLAYAIMCHYEWMVQSADKPASLAAGVPGSEARKVLLPHMTGYFLGGPEQMKGKDDDQKANIRTTRTARQALLTRSFNFATFMAAKHVTYRSFNVKAGAFTVPSKMLIATGDVAVGILANNATIMLDNRPCAVHTTAANGNPTLVPIRASVTQLIRANTPKAERASTADDGSDNVPALVKSLHGILCADDDDKSEAVRKDAYPDAVWNMLAELAAWYDATVNNPAFAAKVTSKAA